MGHQTINPIHGHWLLAKMGKRVLRPGGAVLTHKMIADLRIGAGDEVVELAPGLGYTAALLLLKKPLSYTGVDINQEAVEKLKVKFKEEGTSTRFICASAARSGLPSGCCDRVLGEAMLTMRANRRKLEIIKEAYRLLRPGGSYAIHELGLVPDALPEHVKETISRELELTIRVNARPLTQSEWERLLQEAGFAVQAVHKAPMRLLEPGRLLKDEGVFGLLKMGCHLLSHSEQRKRILQMRRVFRKYQKHLCAFVFVVKKK